MWKNMFRCDIITLGIIKQIKKRNEMWKGMI